MATKLRRFLSDTTTWEGVERLPLPEGEAGQSLLYVVQRAGGIDRREYVLKALKHVDKAARFTKEIVVSRALTAEGHRIADVVDFYVPSGSGRGAFYVMPLYAAGSLRRQIEMGTFVGDLGKVTAFLEEVHAILWRLHAEGCFHRDLKPENTLIDDEGRPLLCDFGRVGVSAPDSPGEGLTHAEEQFGARLYQAPEATAGAARVAGNWAAVDAFAIGKIAYELAAGRRLPGVLARPVGKDYLAPTGGHDRAWRVFNDLVDSLVAVDPAARLAAWAGLPATLGLIKAWLRGRELAPAAETVGARLRAALGASPLLRAGAEAGRSEAARAAFAREIDHAIANGVIDHPGYKQIVSVAREQQGAIVLLPRGWRDPLDTTDVPIPGAAPSLARAGGGFEEGVGWRTPGGAAIRLSIRAYWVSDTQYVVRSLVVKHARDDPEDAVGERAPVTGEFGPAVLGDRTALHQVTEAVESMTSAWTAWVVEEAERIAAG